MKILYIFVLLITTIIYLNLINCQNIHLTDITDVKGGDRILHYNKHPSNSDGESCDFVFDVLAVDWDFSEQEIIVTTDIGASCSIRSQNATAIICGISAYGVAIGQHQLIVTATASTSSDQITINYLCQGIDINALSFKIFNSSDYRKPIVPYNTVISIEGLNYTSIISLKGDPSIISTFQFGLNTFGIYFLQASEDEMLELELLFRYDSVLLLVPNMNKYSKNSDFELSKYPNEPECIEIGRTYPPLYTIKSNSTYDGINYTPIYKSVGLAAPVTIYGNPGNYTYIGAFNEQTSAQTINILARNDNTYIPVGDISWIVTPKLVSRLGQFGGVGQNTTAISTSTMFTPFFFSIQKYDYSIIYYSFHQDHIMSLDWPFGFINGTNEKYDYSASFIRYPISFLSTISFHMKTVSTSGESIEISSFTETDPVYPKIISYEIFHLYNFIFIVKLKLFSDPAIKYTKIGLIKVFGQSYRYEKCTDHEEENPEFELIIPSGEVTSIRIINQLYMTNEYDSYYYYSVDPPSIIHTQTDQNRFQSYLISNISFLFNNVNVNDQIVANIMYFNYTNEQVDRNRTFALKLLDKQNYNPTTANGIDYDELFYSKWNPTLKLFQIEFFVNANIQHGVVPWTLLTNVDVGILSAFFDDSQQLYVNESNFDAYGPIFTAISTIMTQSPNTVGWRFEITDTINGFKQGNITVRGDLDSSIYKFYITPDIALSGDKFIGVYKIEIPLPDNCIDQIYVIQEVLLVDTFGNRGTFSIVSPSVVDPVENVFINYLGDPSINKAQFLCPNPILGDYTSPRLIAFNFIDNIVSEQSITFTFSAQDAESGMKPDQYPVVYASTTTIQTLQCTGEIVSADGYTSVYECKIDLPFGFAYASDLIFSVYGFINNAGLFSGFHGDRIRSLGFPYFISYFDGLGLYRKIAIEKSSKITTDGGDLWLVGREFDIGSSVTISFNNGSIYYVSPISSYSTAMLINVPPTMETFSVTITNSKSDVSNNYIITPIFFNYAFESTSSSSNVGSTSSLNAGPSSSSNVGSSSNTGSSTVAQCSSDCGGISQGFCKEGNCICYSPWVGIDCSSKVIIVPLPQTNNSNPSIEIPITGGDNGNDKENIMYKSIISLVSIREFTFDSKIVNEYTFNSWVYNEINSATNEYNTNITVPSTDGSTTTTSIKATLQWFKEATNITFANEQLPMNPSTIKFSIEISSYKFKSNLNTLQLIMSASFSSSQTNDICSVKQFGETNDNGQSNYIKIQIEDHSLYGRFIKRAIIDSKIKSVENVLLDSSLNSINEASSVQSFIGINIPNYDTSILIDPDFSVLLDSNGASNSNDSVCFSSKGLTTAQLAGIIVGSIAFAAVITTATVYYLVQRRKDIKFKSSMQNKLHSMN